MWVYRGHGSIQGLIWEVFILRGSHKRYDIVSGGTPVAILAVTARALAADYAEPKGFSTTGFMKEGPQGM